MSEKLLPDILKKDNRIKSFAELEKKSFQELSAKVPYLFIYKLQDLSDEELENLAWQFDISQTEWELASDRKQKEELIKNNILLKAKRGTLWAIKRVLGLLDLQGEVQEWFEYGGQPYRFKVELGITNREITTELRDKLINLVNEYKNERSWLEEIILSYLAKAPINLAAGTIAETETSTQMINVFEWTSSGVAFAHTGSMAETQAIANMTNGFEWQSAGKTFARTGSMGETKAIANMIEGFERQSVGTAFIYTGSIAEATAIAIMEA